MRRSLGLDHFVLYGHFWGGMLAIDYALKYQQHLRALVISDMAAGIQANLKRTAALKQSLLSPDKLAQLDALEAKQDYDNPAYDKIMMEDLYPKMICRTLARAPHSRPHPYEPEDLQPDTGQERVCRHRQPQGLGALGPPARDQGPHPHHRCPLRRDGP